MLTLSASFCVFTDCTYVTSSATSPAPGHDMRHWRWNVGCCPAAYSALAWLGFSCLASIQNLLVTFLPTSCWLRDGRPHAPAPHTLDTLFHLLSSSLSEPSISAPCPPPHKMYCEDARARHYSSLACLLCVLVSSSNECPAPLLRPTSPRSHSMPAVE